MRVLLDTHVLLWALLDDSRLSGAHRAVIEDPAVPIFVSAASVWEVGIKRAIGKLDVPETLFDVAARAGCRPLPIYWTHAAAAAALPRHHNDPFDRMLVAQARAEGLSLASMDRAMDAYEVERV